MSYHKPCMNLVSMYKDRDAIHMCTKTRTRVQKVAICGCLSDLGGTHDCYCTMEMLEELDGNNK